MGLSKNSFLRSPALRLSVAWACSWACALAVQGLGVGGLVDSVYAAPGPTALADAPSPAGMGDVVARSLYQRAVVLFNGGDFQNAKKLLGEGLERSPDGSLAKDSLELLRRCNEKLRSIAAPTIAPRTGTGEEVPLDPYAGVAETDVHAPPLGPLARAHSDEEVPLDPYAGIAGPEDPYAGMAEIDGGSDGAAAAGNRKGAAGVEDLDAQAGSVPSETSEDASSSGVSVVAGVWGAVLGLAVVGPISQDNGRDNGISGAAIPVGLVGAAGGIYLGHYLSSKMTQPEGLSVSAGALWGTVNFAFLGDVLTGTDTSTNDIFKSMALGGVVGGGLGYWFNKVYDPTEGQVAVLNSFSLMGTGGGLLIGVAMDPPKSDAYSLNANIGSVAGLLAGIYFRDDLHAGLGKMNWVNLGAAGGALLPWITLYPVLDGGSGGDLRITGFISTLTMLGGGYLGWRFGPDSEETEAEAAAGTALVRRRGNGSWTLGAPALRLMYNPKLAPVTGRSLGLDLLSGRF